MMRIVCHLLTLACSFSAGAQDTFKTGAAHAEICIHFFDRSVNIQLAFAQPGTAIHYTLNNRDPALSDPVYRHPLLIKEGFTTLKARVFGKGFLPSETIATTFIQSGLPIAQLTASTPNARFPGKGHLSLYDNEGGIADLHNINWTGYQGDSVVIDIELEKQSKITGVLGNFYRTMEAGSICRSRSGYTITVRQQRLLRNWQPSPSLPTRLIPEALAFTNYCDLQLP